MNIVTTRFREIDIDESKIIDMRGGILGFEHLKKYVLHIRDDNNPFWWLQSLEDGAIAFVVINPYSAKADYEPMISDNDVKLLEIEEAEDVVLLAIVTIRQKPFSVSVNLRAPLVINAKKKIAKQIVLEDAQYPVQYYLTAMGTGNDVQDSER
ncbi:MAG: flagellar assembly protein FliW [Syntrophales bacterium]